MFRLAAGGRMPAPAQEADLMTDKAPKIDLTPFRIGRG